MTSFYNTDLPPEDYIKTIGLSPNKPKTPSKPDYGIDSPLGLLASSLAAPLYLYASKKGKHEVWDELLDHVPDEVFTSPSLDLGCGRGMALLKVAQRKKALGIGSASPAVGIDIFSTSDQSGNSPVATYANAASLDVLEQVILHKASFTEPLPFIDGAFGLCVSSLAIHNVNEAGRIKAIAEIARVCKPGGRVILVDLMGYVDAHRVALQSMGWIDVHKQFGGVKIMFGMWPCQVLTATKPL